MGPGTENNMLSKKRFLEALDIIVAMFPEAHGELEWETPFQLLIATILSAQATDKGVNKATPGLFANTLIQKAWHRQISQMSNNVSERLDFTKQKRRILSKLRKCW